MVSTVRNQAESGKYKLRLSCQPQPASLQGQELTVASHKIGGACTDGSEGGLHLSCCEFDSHRLHQFMGIPSGYQRSQLR